MVRVRVELTTLALSASCSADYEPIALDELEINPFWRFHFDQSLKVFSAYADYFIANPRTTTLFSLFSFSRFSFLP